MSGIQYHTEGIFATVGIFADLKVTDGNKKIQGETRQKSSIKAVYNDLPSQRIYSLSQWKEMINNDLNWWRIQKSSAFIFRIIVGFFKFHQWCLAYRNIKINFHSMSIAGQTIQMPLL